MNFITKTGMMIMINRLIAILTMLPLLASLAGEDLSDAESKLNKNLKDQQAAEKKLQQTEAQKKQKEKDLLKTKQDKAKTEAELRRSEEEKRKKQESLAEVSQSLLSVEEQIINLKRLQRQQLDNMVRLNFSAAYTRMKGKHQKILVRMASQTRTKLDQLGDVQTVLTEEQNAKNREFSLANSEFLADASAKKNLEYKERTLTQETKNLTKEQQKLETQIANLKKANAQLESLIAQLRSKTPTEGEGTEGAPAVSYKFSAKTITWPLKGKIIRSFGQETRSYNTSVISNGIDISVPEGTTVVAADAGEVAYAGTMGGQGKLVIIDHKNGFHTIYAYNNEILVSVGAKVSKGQAIARSGMTGSASAPSLHFEVRKDGKAVNPLAYLD